MDITELRNAIDTIVIVMMENRSFDHVLGFLSHEDFDGRSDVDGLHRPGPTFSFENEDAQGDLHAPTATADSYLPADLPHGRAAVITQLEEMAMTGFVKAFYTAQANDRTAVPMRFCRPADIPVTAELARANTVCDKWFASLPVDTQPNRLMAMSGSSRIDATSSVKIPSHLLPSQDTVLDFCGNKGLSYEVYVDAQGIADIAPVSNFFLMPSQWGRLDGHTYALSKLRERWGSGTAAPAIVYCEPLYNDFATVLQLHGNCNHPPLPMSFGEAFLKNVYDALTSNPAKWSRTVMIVCYDEHGGFFDHVAPPAIPYSEPPNGEWADHTPFASLGVRIPALVVSPLVDRGSVFHGLLDHTSILQLIVDRFGVPGDLAFFGSAAERKAAGIQSLAEALTRAAPRTELATLRAPPAPQGKAVAAPLTDLGRMFQAARALSKR